jgi:hypothetical protein
LVIAKAKSLVDLWDLLMLLVFLLTFINLFRVYIYWMFNNYKNW